MHTWTVDTHTTRRTGQAETAAYAWHAAHAAAAHLVRGGTLELLTLTVDGQSGTIRPADSGNQAADIANTLDTIEAGRGDVIAAHMRIEEPDEQTGQP